MKKFFLISLLLFFSIICFSQTGDNTEYDYCGKIVEYSHSSDDIFNDPETDLWIFVFENGYSVNLYSGGKKVAVSTESASIYVNFLLTAYTTNSRVCIKDTSKFVFDNYNKNKIKVLKE